MTSSAVFNTVALGAQAAHGTPVAARVIFPVDPGIMPDLDRATTSPEEDHGDISRHHAGRSYHGLRAAGMTLTGEARFEDLPELLEMHAEGDAVPVDAGGGIFEWDYTFDETADSLVRYTLETGADAAQDQWELSDVLVNSLELGFDALTVPGASPWKFSAELYAKDRLQAALTPGLTAPLPLETMLGHHTALHEGPTSEAFGDLDELAAHLAQFRFTSNLNLSRAAYGNATDDTFASYIRGGGEITFDAMVRISSSSKTNVHDIWNVGSSLVTERRWRLAVTGSGDKAMEIDARVAFTAVPIQDRDGERIYGVSGYFVKDPTLASRCRLMVASGVEELPSRSAAGS
jgi:hypothetical protein